MEASKPVLRIAGAVRDPSGQPVAGAVVAAFALDDALMEARPRAHVHSDAQGAFSMRVDGGQEYSITVTAPGRSPAHLLSSALRDRGELERVAVVVGALPAAELQGRLLTHDGRPAGSGMVRIYPPLPGRKQQEIYLALPTAGGEFRVGLAPGDYMLMGDAPDATFSIARVALGDEQRPIEIRLRPAARARPASAVDDLRRKAVPVDLARYGSEQPHGERLQASLCSARIVGIGESTHGSSEFTRLKGQLLLHLAAACGFDALLIESDMAVAAEIDDFVLTGRGDPAAVIRQLGSWPYIHKEFLAFVREVRAHNARQGDRSGKPIHILGIDPYSSQLPADKLVGYLERRGGRRLAAGLTPMRQEDFHGWYAAAAAGERGTLRPALDAVDGFLDKLAHSHRGRPDWRRAVLHLRALQSIEKEVSGTERGRNMADNARWLLDEYLPGGKAVLSAHNGHVLLADPVWKMKETGDWLAEAYGGRYVSVGVFFGSGSFRALERKTGKPMALEKFSLGRPQPESLEAVLDRVGARAFFVDLRTLEQPTRAWLESELPHREVGSMYSSEAGAKSHVAPVLTFHAMAYIAELTAIEMLPK